MLESLLLRMVGCETSSQIWKTLETHFASQTKAKVSQFKTQLQNTRKANSSITDYLLKIKSNVDLLAFVGHIISSSDTIAMVVRGVKEENKEVVEILGIKISHNGKFSHVVLAILAQIWWEFY